MVKSLLREPLMHFLLLGLALFALDAWLRPTTSVATRSEIVVSEARIRSLAQNFSRTWQRQPTREELDGLVESFIREEVMVREALAVGLDRDDAIIRRRLQQKMEFVSEEAAALVRPTDAELSTYLQANPDAFRKEPRATFVQIYLDPRKRTDSLQADARRLIDMLNREGSSPDLARIGDTLMLLEARYENATQAELARLFGNEFADVIVKQPTGRWVGPIASGYGAHLVRVESVAPGGTPALEEVRPALEREWANAKRQELSQAFYASLRAKYAINVKMPEAAKP